jgi:AcrR family transcriptional regulator
MLGVSAPTAKIAKEAGVAEGTLFTYFANKSVVCEVLGGFCRETFMSAQFSELVEISKLNGDFKKNYGRLIGAFLYLRSISAARGRSFFWTGLISIAWSAALAWLGKHGLVW